VAQEAPHDEYLLEVYRQAGENARMYATSRFSNLTGFLTYMGLLTAALAFLYSNERDDAMFERAVPLVSLFGCVLSILFWAMEIRHHHYWQHYELGVVKSLEALMPRGQYPAEAQIGQRRSFITGPRLFGLGATTATYGIYVASLAFFLVIGVASLVS
jgi:hypothetical protein